MFFEAEETSAILVVDPDRRLREQLDEIFNGSSDASLSKSATNLTYLFDGVDSMRVGQGKNSGSAVREYPLSSDFCGKPINGWRRSGVDKRTLAG